MLDYFKYLDKIFYVNKNQYIKIDKLYENFNILVHDEIKDRDMDYLFMLHLMVYDTSLPNFHVENIKGLNNSIKHIGIFEENLDDISTLSDNSVSSLDEEILSCEDESDDNSLLLISRNDVIDYVINNKENKYLVDLLLSYRENDNNIMHLLFLNGNNKEIDKLLNINSFYLLIEKNKDNLCAIDYIDKNSLKKVLQKCIKSNYVLNEQIIDIFEQHKNIKNNTDTLYKSINWLSILLSTSIIYILYS